jgi:ribonuclease HI
VIGELTINISKPCGFFDGVAQLNTRKSGPGGVLYFTKFHWITIEYGLRSQTNNLAKIKSMIILMTITLEVGVRHMNIYGDSKPIISYMNGSKEYPYS